MAKKLNTKLATFLVGGGLAVGAAALVGPQVARVLHRSAGDPQRLVSQGDDAMRKGDWEAAEGFYKIAASIDANNTDTLVKYGDALERLTLKEPTYLQLARSQWDKAVSIDPRCTPALERLLKSYWDQLELSARADLFGQVRVVADKLLAVHPGDIKVLGKKYIATVRQWRQTSTVSRPEASATVDAMQELIKKDPDNAELPLHYADARVEQGREAIDGANRIEADRLFLDAKDTMGAARAAHPDTAAFHFYAYKIYRQLSDTDPKGNLEKKEAVKERVDEYAKLADDALNRAQALAAKLDPAKDPMAAEIQFTAANWASERGNDKIAEGIVRSFYDAHRDDQRARLAMARLLENKRETDPAKLQANRDEAAKILAQDMVATESLSGFKALVLRDLQAQTIAELIRLRMTEWMSTADASKRKTFEDQIEEGFDKLRRLYSARAIQLLDLEGRVHLMKNEYVEAVRVLEEAARQMTPTMTDYDLLFQLARAYIGTGQPGLARERLEQVVAKLDRAAPPRLMLAQILLQANDLQGAVNQLNVLQRIAPNLPEVARLADMVSLATSGTDEGTVQQREAAYGKLQETNRSDRLTKANVAQAIGKTEEAIRLFKSVLVEDSADVNAVTALTNIYLSRDMKDSARAVLADALRAKPDDPSLAIAKARLDGALPAEMYDIRKRLAEKMTDPFAREMQMVELESGPGGDADKIQGHLQAAIRIKPDDVKALDLDFQYLVGRGRYDAAGPVVESLAKLNADHCDGLVYRERLAGAKGDLAAAEGFARQLTESYKEYSSSWFTLAQILQARGKFDEAVQDYLEVTKRQPGHYDAMRALVECYYQLNRPEAVKVKLAEARKWYPNDLNIREMYLNHLVDFDDPNLAIPDREEILKNALDQQRVTADDYLSLAKAYFHAAQYEAISKAAESQDHLAKAIDTLQQGQAKFPDDARFYSQIAEMDHYDHKFPVGEAVLLKLFARPDKAEDPEPSSILAEYYARAGKLAKAEEYLTYACVKSDGKRPRTDASVLAGIDFRLRLASVLTNERNFEKATATLDGIPAEVAARDARVQRQRLEILIAQGKSDEAKKGLEAALATNDSSDLHNLLASVLIDERKPEEAMKELDHVLARDPRNEAAVYLKALAIPKLHADNPQGRQNLMQQSITLLRGLRDKSPRNMQVHLLLGEMFEKTGRSDLAIEDLVDALSHSPGNREVRLGLIRLYRGQHPPKWDLVLKLCLSAEADPVLRSDPTWAREHALALSGMVPSHNATAADAILMWYRLMELVPDNVDYRREFHDILLQFKDYNAVVQQTGQMLDNGHNEWWLHHQRALALAHVGTRDASVAEFTKALAATNPRDDATQYEFILRAIASNVGGDTALQRLKPLLTNDPDNRWRLLQASLLRTKGDFAAALAGVETMLADPANKVPDRRVPILRAKADICRSQAKPDYLKARNAYLEILTYQPEDLVSLNNVAFDLAENISAADGGGPLAARKYSSRAYELVRWADDPSMIILDTHGWVLARCGGGDVEQGIKILTNVVDRDTAGRFIEGRYHLGFAYLQPPTPNAAVARDILTKANELIREQEAGKDPVDSSLKDKIQTALARAIEMAAAK